MSAQIKLIVGLGNPGKEYATTRHNAGAMWLQALCAEQNVTLQQTSKFNGLSAKISIAENIIYCILPTTFMNLSGKAVASIASYYAIDIAEILVVHDELDLDVGTVRLKQGGGHGGHNGLRDIIAALSGNNFWRLRIGIGHPGHKDLVSDYVLQAPSKTDKIAIDSAIEASLAVLPQIINGDIAKAQEQLHKV